MANFVSAFLSFLPLSVVAVFLPFKAKSVVIIFDRKTLCKSATASIFSFRKSENKRKSPKKPWCLSFKLIGKKVIVLGDVFYRYFTGSIPIFSISELEVALNNKNFYKFTNDLTQIDYNIAELANFALKSYKGDPQPSDSLYTNENLQNIINAFNQELI